MLTPLKMALRDRGFDIVHPFPLKELTIDSPYFQALSPQLGGARTGLLIGNTRGLWVHFLAWLAEHPGRRFRDNPLDDYARDVITQAAREHLDQARLFWTHETDAYLVPVQELCHQSGLAHLSRGRFNVHPEYGPWLGMRALIAIPDDLRIPLSPAVDPSAPAVEARVAAHFEVLCARASAGLNSTHIRTSWEDWLGLRDLYDIGRAYRYTAPQIRYHYTKDKSVLVDELARCASDCSTR